MTDRKTPKPKKTLRIISIILVVLLVLATTFFIYTQNYYHADLTAIESIQSDTEYSVDKNLAFLRPDKPNGTGIIFYPGAKVEYTAYLPLLNGLCQQGITCVLVKMPFNLAIFNLNAANDVYEKVPEIQNWFISGHSLGGAMASKYYEKHQNQLKGLILLGAYIYGDVPVENTLTIYGTEDHILDRSKITYTENIFLIEGGNHAQFGNYGVQSRDGTPTITSSEQQKLTDKYIVEFINNVNINH